MNFECGTDELEELGSAFRFNDAVLRNMVISRKEAVTEPSLLVKRVEEKRDTRPSAPAVQKDAAAAYAPEKAAAEAPAADEAADDAKDTADADATTDADATADADATTEKTVAPESNA